MTCSIDGPRCCLAGDRRVADRGVPAAGGQQAVVWRSGCRPRDDRWILEELRVSLFAQTLGTDVPPSRPRLCA
ncbi:MAG: DUF3418 domain-containing protein [Geodermatophilaceae bacterium]